MVFDDDADGLIVGQVLSVQSFITSLEILEVIKSRNGEGDLPEDKLLRGVLHDSSFFKGVK
jgi:hypothetical protein